MNNSPTNNGQADKPFRATLPPEPPPPVRRGRVEVKRHGGRDEGQAFTRGTALPPFDDLPVEAELHLPPMKATSAPVSLSHDAIDHPFAEPPPATVRVAVTVPSTAVPPVLELSPVTMRAPTSEGALPAALALPMDLPPAAAPPQATPFATPFANPFANPFATLPPPPGAFETPPPPARALAPPPAPRAVDRAPSPLSRVGDADPFLTLDEVDASDRAILDKLHRASRISGRFDLGALATASVAPRRPTPAEEEARERAALEKLHLASRRAAVPKKVRVASTTSRSQPRRSPVEEVMAPKNRDPRSE